MGPLDPLSYSSAAQLPSMAINFNPQMDHMIEDGKMGNVLPTYGTYGENHRVNHIRP